MGCSNSHFLILEPLAFVYRQCRAIWFTLGRGIRILLVCKFLDSVILYRVEIHSLEGTCHAYAASPFFLGVGRWQKSACPPCHHICCNANFSFHPIGGMPGGLRQATPDARNLCFPFQTTAVQLRGSKHYWFRLHTGAVFTIGLMQHTKCQNCCTSQVYSSTYTYPPIFSSMLSNLANSGFPFFHQ